MRAILSYPAFALAALVAHLATNGRYGYFRDELYFLACGEHLDWGYVDHAPLIALVAKISRLLLGDSLHAIRFFPALAHALLIVLTGCITRELGGKRFAVALACLAVLLTPLFLISGTLLTMNAFEPLFWMGCAYVLLLAIQRDNPKLLLWFGVLAGIGLENKHSMAFFAFAVAAALLLTPQRRLFRTRWIWIAAAIALALFLPNLIWQYRHGWPTLEDLSNVRKMHKNVELSPLAFLAQQILLLNPVSAPLWIAGLWFLFKRCQPLAYTYAILLALMMLMHGKTYYLAPVYPMLFAAGAVAWEQQRRLWPRIALAAALAATGLLFAPLTLPVLPVETFLRYQRAMPFQPPKTEVAHEGPLPQYFGDMFGWPEMVETVARVYHSLPPDERAKAAILAGNYGEAGAIDFFGPRLGLPKAISAHQTYFFWGPRDYTGEVVIGLQQNRQGVERACRSVEAAAPVSHPYAMAEEHYTILICRGLHVPLRQLWPRLKHWN